MVMTVIVTHTRWWHSLSFAICNIVPQTKHVSDKVNRSSTWFNGRQYLLQDARAGGPLPTCAAAPSESPCSLFRACPLLYRFLSSPNLRLILHYWSISLSLSLSLEADTPCLLCDCPLVCSRLHGNIWAWLFGNAVSDILIASSMLYHVNILLSIRVGLSRADSSLDNR